MEQIPEQQRIPLMNMITQKRPEWHGGYCKSKAHLLLMIHVKIKQILMNQRCQAMEHIKTKTSLHRNRLISC